MMNRYIDRVNGTFINSNIDWLLADLYCKYKLIFLKDCIHLISKIFVICCEINKTHCTLCSISELISIKLDINIHILELYVVLCF